MSAAQVAAAGFLTVVADDDFGLCGGYLLLNAAGRPLEFHCTAPVRASRAQEILYGPTLRGYLYEQIAPALLQKAKLTPALVCTDSLAMLAASAASPAPLVLVPPDEAAADVEVLARFRLGACDVALPADRRHEQSSIEERWRELHAEHLDLREPFERIHEALAEAQRSARPAA